MDRVIVSPGALPLDTDILTPQQVAMIAVGWAMQAALGTPGIATGLVVVPASPASLSVVAQPGGLLVQEETEIAPYGSLPSTNGQPIFKMGINPSATTLGPFVAPGTAGQSVAVLITASFSEVDGSPAILNYWNAANPAAPYAGPGNDSASQNTRRRQIVTFGSVMGTSAATGTQATPATPSGTVPLAVVTIAYGQTTIASGNIAAHPSAPYCPGLLNQHHLGIPGQAPQIDLTTEVRNSLPQAKVAGSPFVRMGQGPSQLANVVSVGWDGTLLRVSIDGTDKAGVAFQSWVTTQITAEATTRAANDTAEATARTAAITAEATARAAEDTTLQNNITAEATARTAADTAILAKFTNGGAAANATATFANGYIRKRGTVNSTTGNGDLIYFDTPFPNACVNVVVSESEAAGWEVGGVWSPVSYGTQKVDNTCFRLYAIKGGGPVGGATVDWQAEGI